MAPLEAFSDFYGEVTLVLADNVNILPQQVIFFLFFTASH
jgi:hypothetical protein